MFIRHKIDTVPWYNMLIKDTENIQLQLQFLWGEFSWDYDRTTWPFIRNDHKWTKLQYFVASTFLLFKSSLLFKQIWEKELCKDVI